MDAKTFIDDLLASAKRLSTQGRSLAEDKLGVPAAGERRDAMLDGMGKGALAAGALALLLGTGSGRRLTGSALKLGGLAAVGALAYKAYQNWQGGSGAGPGTPVGELDGAEVEARSRLLLDAMILAAMADGHIDDAERQRIIGQLGELGLDDDAEALIRERLTQPLDVTTLAARADSAEAAAEIYVVSRQVIDRANAAEQHHLDALVAALQLDAELVAELERQLAAN
ncbi:MAG: tellurite resistance TerB family protein [Gammaproteobacteria bacterium]|nr:tellurite resistance TerB family protein [Gammaproteobacteria bacterium]